MRFLILRHRALPTVQSNGEIRRFHAAASGGFRFGWSFQSTCTYWESSKKRVNVQHLPRRATWVCVQLLNFKAVSLSQIVTKSVSKAWENIAPTFFLLLLSVFIHTTRVNILIFSIYRLWPPWASCKFYLSGRQRFKIWFRRRRTESTTVHRPEKTSKVAIWV